MAQVVETTNQGKNLLFDVVSMMSADDQVIQGARASTVMVLS